MCNDKALLEIVNEEALKWRYLARSQNDIDALRRLVERDSALSAWRKIYAKAHGDDFRVIASMIARGTVNAHLSRCDLKKKAEIEEAGAEAASVARRLVLLIESNKTLQGFHEDEILDPLELASMERIRMGLLSLALLPRENHEGWFGEKIEEDLDARQAPQFKGLTTSLAYRVVSGHSVHEQLLQHLRNFAAFAERSKELGPVVPKPQGLTAAAHAYGLSVCGTLAHYLGSPRNAVVAGLVCAVFDTDEVTEETVKGWWKRRGDKT